MDFRKGIQELKKLLLEIACILFSILKWTLLAVAAGIISGIGVALFLRLLGISLDKAALLPGWALYISLPLGILASVWMIRLLAPDAAGHGTEKVIEAVHEHDGVIDLKVVPVKMITTIITLAAGGSVGTEGPATQIGGGLASTLARYLKLDSYDCRKLVICGVAGGFTAVFGTPLAGAMFALEILFIGGIVYDVLYPSFLAAFVSWRVSLLLGMKYTHCTNVAIPGFTAENLMLAIAAGIVFGLVSLCLIEVMNKVEKIFHGLKISVSAKAVLGSALILLLVHFVGRDCLGLSSGPMSEILKGSPVSNMSWFWKILLTSLTLACGGSGGIVTPISYIGLACGAAFAQILGFDTVFYAALGLIGLLSGSANAPIAAILIGIEIFGADIAPYAAVVSGVGFVMVGHRSVFPSQRIVRNKSVLLEMSANRGRIDHDCSTLKPENSPFIKKIMHR